MSTELQDAFSQAAQGAKAEFETRNAVDVIQPAARRVTRHRATMWVGAGLASVAVLGMVLWGVDTIAGSRATPIDPAASALPDANADIPGDAWSTLDLAVRAKPRQQGRLSGDATAGMICHHATPADDPRVVANGDDPTVSHRTSLEDCGAVWFANGPTTTLTNWSVSASELDHSFTYNFSIHNDSAQPIAVDAESVFMWVETAPDATTDQATSYSSTVVGESMWDTTGDVTALLDSGAEPLVIAADGTYSSAITATTGTAEGDALAELLASGEPYRVSLWARVHEAAPSGVSTYLIQLGSNNDASWSLSGGSNADSPAWTVDDLAATTEPRKQGETRPDATAGMACRRTAPGDDAEQTAGDPPRNIVFTIAGCDPVWFVGGPTTISDAKSVDALTDADGTLTYSWDLTNTSDKALQIDTNSSFVWIETDPTVPSDDISVYNDGVLIAPSMWTSTGGASAMLSSDTSWQSVTPGSSFGDQRSVPYAGDDKWPLAGAVPGSDPVTISVWAPVVDNDPNADTTYIIQLGKPAVYLATAD